MSWSWSISAASLIPIALLVIFIITMDVLKKTPGKRGVRVLFTLIAGVALYTLMVPLQRKIVPEKKDVIVQTSTEAIPDSLVTENSIVFNDFISWLKNENQVASDSLTLYGPGLAEWELAMIQQPFSYYPTEIPEGIISVSLPPVFEGMQVELAGDIILDSSALLTLNLPGGGRYSLQLAPSDSQFSAAITFPTAGNQLIELLGTRDQDTLFIEMFPVSVLSRPKQKVLLLSGFPTFEQKALVEWMESMDYEVTTIQQLTEERYRTNFYNQPIDRKLKTNASFIKGLDLLILDRKGLSSVGRNVRETIKSQINKGELGLIWLDEPTELAAEFNLKVNDAKHSQVEIQSPKGQILLSSWDEYISNVETTERQSDYGRSVETGFGVIMQPVFSNSYLLKLQGQDSIYNELWSGLLSSTLGVKRVDELVSYDPYGVVSKKSTVKLAAPINASFKIGNQAMHPRQNELNRSWVRLDYFPEQEGWRPIFVNDTLIDHAYAAPADNWQTRNEYKKQRLTRRASTQSQVLAQPEFVIAKPIDKWWWYAVLLFSLAILWIEHRIRS